mgnify:CR=1 FL=1
MAETLGTAHWPTEIRLARDRRTLDVAFDDGTRYALPAELLRVESPSAEVQGHSPRQKQLVGGKRAVAITAVEPVGHYAVRLVFDDGHESGLFTWRYLHELGRDRDRVWRRYLEALAGAGMSRDG